MGGIANTIEHILVTCRMRRGVGRADSRSEGPEIHAFIASVRLCFKPPERVGSAIVGEMGDPQG